MRRAAAGLCDVCVAFSQGAQLHAAQLPHPTAGGVATAPLQLLPPCQALATLHNHRYEAEHSR